MKICKVCEIEKDLSFFNKKYKGKDGFNTKCKECEKEYNKNYYLLNKEYFKKHNKDWNSKNRDIKNEKARIYYEENKELCSEKSKIYREKNKEQLNYNKKNWEKNRSLSEKKL